MKNMANIFISTLLGLTSAICSAQTPAQFLEKITGRSLEKDKSDVKPGSAPAQVRQGQSGGSFVDKRDGATYNTVNVGTQVWTAENAAFKPKGASSWAYDNDENNGKKLGRLYTWDAAQEACPQGWRLPSEKDWATLIDFLGGENVAGKKMKAAGDAWEGDAGGRNETGLNVLPAGLRGWSKKYDEFMRLGVDTTFWTSTIPPSTKDSVIFSVMRDDSVIRATSHKDYGFSVRCIKK